MRRVNVCSAGRLCCKLARYAFFGEDVMRACTPLGMRDRPRAEGGVASKLGDETRLMTMKGGNVLESVKMLACMFGGM